MPNITNRNVFTATYTERDIKNLIIEDIERRTGQRIIPGNIEPLYVGSTPVQVMPTDGYKIEVISPLPVPSPVAAADWKTD